MSSEPIEVIITQKKIDELKNKGIIYITDDKLIDNYDNKKHYLFKIKEDIEIYGNLNLNSVSYVYIINSTITIDGVFSGCSSWNFISSTVINNNKFQSCNNWHFINSKIINNNYINQCHGLYSINSNIINYSKIEASTTWFLLSSSIINKGTITSNCKAWFKILQNDFPLVKKEDHDKLQLELDKLKSVIGNIDDEKLRKLLLYMYLKEKDNRKLKWNI